jgi:hypothetical protein
LLGNGLLPFLGRGGSGTFHSFNSDKYLMLLLGWLLLPFNRLFSLAGMTVRILNAASCCGSAAGAAFRLAEVYA